MKILSIKVSDLDFKGNTGIRTGILIQPEDHPIDSKFYWTHFSTKAKNRIPIRSQQIISEFFSGFYSLNVFFGARMKWGIDMNMVDYAASHTFQVGDNLKLIPSLGVKGGYIKQDINVNWDAIIYTSQEKVINNFRGIGPSFSILGEWEIWQNVNLIADLSAALMWGTWNVRDTYTRPQNLNLLILPTTITTSMNHTKLGTAMYQYFLGLEYHNQSKLNFKLKAGYEMQYWASQLRLVTFQQLPTHGDLTFQGATCGIIVYL